MEHIDITPNWGIVARLVELNATLPEGLMDELYRMADIADLGVKLMAVYQDADNNDSLDARLHAVVTNHNTGRNTTNG